MKHIIDQISNPISHNYYVTSYTSLTKVAWMCDTEQHLATLYVLQVCCTQTDAYCCTQTGGFQVCSIHREKVNHMHLILEWLYSVAEVFPHQLPAKESRQHVAGGSPQASQETHQWKTIPHPKQSSCKHILQGRDREGNN